ncbi:MAG: hypothetical protein RXR20_04775 [Paraburkholderia sp.]|uniref:hypothetical protein n=1 Tax=Burkholderia sp. 4M9327F10 TaxID=2502223 RepID=UPI002018223C|nr:hypothetical protein [Burkholderia sp. 4M9327F10]
MVVGVIVAVAVMAGVCVIVLVTVSMPVVVVAAAGVLMLVIVIVFVFVSVALGVCVSVLMAVRVAVRMAAATGVVMLVSVRMAVGVIVRMPFSFAVRMPASGPFTVCPVVIMGMRVLIPLHNGDIRLMIVPAIPAAVRMVMVFPRRVSMRLMTGMTIFMVIGFLQNPLWVGVSARFTVLVTVRFGVAGVRHGGFLARFVV